MNVCLLSSFRNSERYLLEYAARVLALRAGLARHGDTLTCVWGEGDSTDGTRTLLDDIAASTDLDAEIVDVAHGGPHFGSIVHPVRFKQLAHVGNTLLMHLPDSTDAVLIVESDLIWQAETLLRLLGHLATVDAVAPMVMDSPPARTFYDIYAFVKDGMNFVKAPPFHPALAHAGPGLVAMESVGSCVAVRGAVARRCRFPEENVFVGFCKQVNWFGGRVALDPTCPVCHP